MNKHLSWMAAVAAGLCLGGSAAKATLYSYDFNSGFSGGSTVSDGDATGWVDNRTVSDITGDSTISSVSVHVNMSGGYAGDMYGYLVLTDASTHSALGFSVLLNRVGTGSGGSTQFTFGYSDAALNVVLSDTGANGNIHNYQNVSGYSSLISSGGAFQTDGGNLGNFAGASANNTWTLFLADESSGSIMSINDWGLDIEVVPEPTTWALAIFGLVAAGLVARRVVSQRRLRFAPAQS